MIQSHVSVDELGVIIRETRKALGMTQQELAFTSGTGLRFISELERGKPTCQIGKVLKVIRMLGMGITLTLPVTIRNER